MPRVRGPSGWETILVVDDEPRVLSVTCALLSGTGYDVLQAASGAEAIGLCQARKSPIHLLLTDIMMPNMMGTELAEYLQALYPDLRVLFMSGYGDDQLERYRQFSSMFFMRKPFTPAVLLTTVRRVLDMPQKREPGREDPSGGIRKAGGN